MRATSISLKVKGLWGTTAPSGSLNENIGVSPSTLSSPPLGHIYVYTLYCNLIQKYI